MPQTRWNKGQTIVNSDAYNLSGDLATLDDTLNVTVPVASDTERNALTPPQGVFAGMRVARTDKPGIPDEVRDSGGVWNLHPALLLAFHNAVTNNYSGLMADLSSGVHQLMLQGGSDVVTPDANGYAAIVMPSSFANGVIFTFAQVGDYTAITNGTKYNVTSAPGAFPLSQIHVNVNANGTPWVGPCRLNWFAAGW